jgi:hypothetical protein
VCAAVASAGAVGMTGPRSGSSSALRKASIVHQDAPDIE